MDKPVIKEASRVEEEVEERGCKTKPTLEFLLRPNRIDMDTLRREHTAILGLVTKMLGKSWRVSRDSDEYKPQELEHGPGVRF